jgi:chemotaxis receptor (MCP) glutamine deamidase CheD
MASREIYVAPDRFEVTSEDVILITELRSAIAVCVYDAAEQAGALLHLSSIAHSSKPADVTDTTLATELLLLERCLEALREAVPGARQLQGRIVAHIVDDAQAQSVYKTILGLLRHILTDAGVELLPEDSAAGAGRTLRFRPAMGLVQTRA